MDEGDQSGGSSPLECAVCLQSYIHPVRLSCGHIFCYLCVKGVAAHSKRCPMCRGEIPADYLEHPQLMQSQPAAVAEPLLPVGGADSLTDGNEAVRWFYQGGNGWWEYDVRTSMELERQFKTGQSSCEVLLAGFLYTIDLQNMVQFRRNEPQRKRNVLRDHLGNVPNLKGVAGLRLQPQDTAADRHVQPQPLVGVAPDLRRRNPNARGASDVA